MEVIGGMWMVDNFLVGYFVVLCVMLNCFFFLGDYFWEFCYNGVVCNGDDVQDFEYCLYNLFWEFCYIIY